MKKKILRAAVAIFFSLLVLIVVFAPLGAKLYVNKHGKDIAGRTISLDKLRFNYLTFTVRAIRFKIYEKDDITVFTGFDTLLVDLQPLKFIRSELSIKRLWLVNPVSSIIKYDSTFNFSDIIEFFSSADTLQSSDITGSGTNFKFEISDIRLVNGQFSYTDKIVNHETLLENFSFAIPYISWNQEESSRAGLKFNFRNGGYFEADASFDPVKGDFISHIVIHDLDLGEFTAYLKPYINLGSMVGLAGCNLNIKGNTDESENLLAGGSMYVNSLSVTDSSMRKITGIDSMNVTFNNTFPLKSIFNIGNAELIRPYLLFEMKDSSNNFIDLLPRASAGSIVIEKADTAASPFSWSLKSFAIRDGIIDFSDLSFSNPFNYHLSQIEFITDSLSSSASWMNVLSTMKLNNQGDLRADVGFNPSDLMELKVEYVITNFQLTDISPYSIFYVGSPIIYGNMYYAGKTTITARQINSQNKLIIRNAEIGRKTGGIFNIPLRLALYLIKDMRGDITIDLPVSGNLNDPKIKFGPLIWKTFTNLIIKIAATPFVALSNMFGVDEKDLQQLDFNYVDTLLSADNTRKLDQLIIIQNKKPELNIELAYFNDRSLEKQDLALTEADTSMFESIIDFREAKRISLVKDYLSLKDSLSRIKVFIPGKSAVRNTGSRPVFEIKFSMED
jgi:hypothetical protein